VEKVRAEVAQPWRSNRFAAGFRLVMISFYPRPGKQCLEDSPPIGEIAINTCRFVCGLPLRDHEIDRRILQISERADKDGTTPSPATKQKNSTAAPTATASRLLGKTRRRA